MWMLLWILLSNIVWNSLTVRGTLKCSHFWWFIIININIKSEIWSGHISVVVKLLLYFGGWLMFKVVHWKVTATSSHYAFKCYADRQSLVLKCLCALQTSSRFLSKRSLLSSWISTMPALIFLWNSNSNWSNSFWSFSLETKASSFNSEIVLWCSHRRCFIFCLYTWWN